VGPFAEPLLRGLSMDAFFGIQLAVQSPPGDPWRSQLRELVRRHQRDLRIADQRVLYGALANLLHDALPRAALGYWDFVADGAGEYADWVKGLEDDSLETWAPDHGAQNDHVLATAVFLLPQDQPSAMLVGERCDLPESTWMHRATFAHLLETLTMLRFRSVRSDAVYVTPGGPDLAFSLRELQGKGYEYLLPIA